MSIEKKSLINTLKTTKKANVAASPTSEGHKKETVSSMVKSFKNMKQFKSLKKG